MTAARIRQFSFVNRTYYLRRSRSLSTIAIQLERLGDISSIRYVNLQAFDRPDEADLIDALRKADHPLISLVAVESSIREKQIPDRVIGHILFSPVTIHSTSAVSSATALGPLAVLPEYQGQGIGSQLVEAGLEACREAGEGLVFVLGHPGYYSRFGFEAARPLGLAWEHNAPAGSFMVKELSAGALAGHNGVVRYLPAFNAV